MVGIAQLNLAADLPEVKGVHASLDSGLRAHVHKDRRLDISVDSVKHTALCPAFLFD